MPKNRTVPDHWSRWIFDHRFGRDEKVAKEGMGQLYQLRDRVLSAARLSPGDTVLDIGSGDGFIAAAALQYVEPGGHVIFSDISAPLLEHCRSEMDRQGKSDMCSFVEISAEMLDGIADESVDAVTSRSTLVYLNEKKKAVGEFVRVLRTGGRISLLEPIARYGWQERSQRYLTWDMTAIGELGNRLDDAYKQRDTSTSARYDLTERDLVEWAEEFDMKHIHLDFTIDIGSTPAMSWEAAMEWAPNPCTPTLGEILDDLFTESEQGVVVDHLRPLVERGEAVQRQAIAHVTAIK